jgi:hypothetical protein
LARVNVRGGNGATGRDTRTRDGADVWAGLPPKGKSHRPVGREWSQNNSRESDTKELPICADSVLACSGGITIPWNMTGQK